MNARQKPKIELFLTGLAEKHRQNADYFTELVWFAYSGRKEYVGRVYVENGRFIYQFAGKKNYESFEALLHDLVQTLLPYDRATVEYRERGKGCRILMDERTVRLENFEIVDDSVSAQGLKDKTYHMNLSKATALLKRLGFMTEDGKIRNDSIRKYNQTDRFLDLVGDMFDGQENIHIVDCACGKSYLSFILNHYLWEERHIRATFTGIDIKPNVIEESRKIASDLGYKNMNFICEDLRTFDGQRPDTVISLHACDTATDMALGFAIRNNARNIICVPCCHKELLDQYKISALDPILRHGIFRTRLNDILTDGLRCLKLEACGYDVSCVEYCSPLDTPKNLLIKAVKVSDANKDAQASYTQLLSQLQVKPSIEYYSVKMQLEEFS